MYERRLENRLYRTMGELRKQQVLRELKAAEEVSGEVSSLRCEVSSKQSQLPGTPSLPTSDFTLPTSAGGTRS